MVLTEGFFRRYSCFIKDMNQKGKLILFNGSGLREYSKNEADIVASELLKIKKHIVITRDELTYKLISRTGLNIRSGIDCAWFIKDATSIPKVELLEKYEIYNYDNKGNKKLLAKNNNTSSRCINTHHSAFHRHKWQLKHPNTYIADNYMDYLTLYKNARKVETDRIHTAIASIAFNTPVSLFTDSERVHMFTRVGCEIKTNNHQNILVNRERLAFEKENSLVLLKESMGNV